MGSKKAKKCWCNIWMVPYVDFLSRASQIHIKDYFDVRIFSLETNFYVKSDFSAICINDSLCQKKMFYLFTYFVGKMSSK